MPSSYLLVDPGFLAPLSSVQRRSRRTFSTHFEIFRRRFDGVMIYFFNSDFKFFSTTRRNFQSVLSMLFLLSLKS